MTILSDLSCLYNPPLRCYRSLKENGNAALKYVQEQIRKIPVDTPTVASSIGNWTVVTGWGDFKNHLLSYYKAVDIQEKEKARDLLTIDAINFSYSFIFVSQIFFKNIYNTPINTLKSFLHPIGFASSSLGFYFEIQEVGRSHEFLKELTATSDVAKNIFSLNETYFQKTSENILGTTRLALRVQPWCQKETQDKLPSILDKLKNETTKEEGIKEGKELLETLKTQGKKTLYIHVFSVIGFALTSVGCFALICGISAIGSFSVTSILLTGHVLCLLSSTCASISLPCKGWSVDCKLAFPKHIRRFIF